MTSEEYIKMQKMWLKATGVKEDSWVKVTRAAESHESGWGNSWTAEMDECVGEVMQISAISGSLGIGVVDSCFDFPFFILEPAEAPKKKYEFKPFEQVLVRDANNEVWRAELFGGRYIKDSCYPYECVNSSWRQCIPYAGHEHLLGTTDKPEYWENYYDKE